MNGTAATEALGIPAEAPRIKKFRRELIETIPRFPNNKASLKLMQQKCLGELLVHYVNWRSRYVGRRSRTVSIERGVQQDPRWSAKAACIEAFLEKVQRGDDLTPHLSIKPHTKGYTPAANAPGATVDDRWSDKDFVLNVMGYHHFHLGTKSEQRGHAERTDEIIFAEVQRDTFRVIAIFDHDVFESNSAERMRLWAMHQNLIFRDIPPGTPVIMGGIASSGHSDRALLYAQHCARVIKAIDPKLDDPEFVRSLYRPRDEAPAKPKPGWLFAHLDFGIFDKAKPACLILHKGWN
jgi:hypothetical protein